jgi:alpha-L-fucosidase 2
MAYAAILQPQVKDGLAKVDGLDMDIENATECWLKVSAATNFNYQTY